MSRFPLEVDLRIETPDWPEGLESVAERAIRQAVDRSDTKLLGPVEISVLLTNDAAQKAINLQWRGKEVPTNVLSFPQFEPFSPMVGLLGDLSLARETIAREAEDLDKPFADHFAHLLVHGTLHLIGYDHQTDEDALVMESLETDILADLGIVNPYAEV